MTTETLDTVCPECGQTNKIMMPEEEFCIATDEGGVTIVECRVSAENDSECTARYTVVVYPPKEGDA